MKTKEQMNKEIQSKFPFLELIGDYTGANNKSLIRCNDCGYEWYAVPRSVANSKCGCVKCKLATSKVDRSLNHFLSKYDTTKYELIEFKDCMHVTVKCKTCDYLRTTNANNIYRFGCPKCGQKSTHDKQRLSITEFVKRARELHHNKYNYDKVEYVSWNTPVIITCPEHGDFAQIPGKHLRPEGCPKCVGKYKTTQDIINLCREKHGDKYDYSKVEYISADKPITIICPKHGEFRQIPYVHYKRGCGCPKCSSSHGEQEVSTVLDSLKVKYLYQIPLNNPYKENKRFILDFYIPEYKLIIEYNGEQHYGPIEYFGGDERFKKQVERDNDLRKYCKENNFKLLEIKYTENVKDKIINFIENCRALE